MSRATCDNAEHRDDLRGDYISDSNTADDRLARGWTQDRCPDCQHYVWHRPEGSP